LLVPPDQEDLHTTEKAVSVFANKNPYTSLEIVFFEHRFRPDCRRILHHVKLDRPHYLDGDLRYLYPEPGNRAVLFTRVTEQSQSLLQGPMQRNVFWWRKTAMPSVEEIHSLEALQFDGLLIDVHGDYQRQESWQEVMASQAEDLLRISFGLYHMQHRWLQKAAEDDYYLEVLPRE
jgi:hypothetical protein